MTKQSIRAALNLPDYLAEQITLQNPKKVLVTGMSGVGKTWSVRQYLQQLSTDKQVLIIDHFNEYQVLELQTNITVINSLERGLIERALDEKRFDVIVYEEGYDSGLLTKLLGLADSQIIVITQAQSGIAEYVPRFDMEVVFAGRTYPDWFLYEYQVYLLPTPSLIDNVGRAIIRGPMGIRRVRS